MSYYQNKIEALEAENARLKAEIDNSNRINTELLLLSNKQASEVRRLKAEVEALKLGSLLTAVDVLQFINLKAENERLRKAGDYLADHLAHEFGTCPSIEVWNAAKEGKPSV